jgi:hypothetical protein
MTMFSPLLVFVATVLVAPSQVSADWLLGHSPGLQVANDMPTTASAIPQNPEKAGIQIPAGAEQIDVPDKIKDSAEPTAMLPGFKTVNFRTAYEKTAEQVVTYLQKSGYAIWNGDYMTTGRLLTQLIEYKDGSTRYGTLVQVMFIRDDGQTAVQIESLVMTRKARFGSAGDRYSPKNMSVDATKTAQLTAGIAALSGARTAAK